FQAAQKLLVTGIVDGATAAALDTAASRRAPAKERTSVLAVAPWLSVMRAITGTKEFPGGTDNPIILEWALAIALRYPDLRGTLAQYKHDSIPWCGLGMAYSVAMAGYRPPAEPLYATNWFYAWKDGVRLEGPALGAIAVLTRNGGGHVTQYEGENDDYWFGRGCNQSDMVNVAKFPKSRKVLGWMWPKGAPRPTGGRVRTSFSAAVSAKES